MRWGALLANLPPSLALCKIRTLAPQMRIEYTPPGTDTTMGVGGVATNVYSMYNPCMNMKKGFVVSI